MSDQRQGGSPAPCRIDISRLRSDQVALLRSVLNAGDVPYGIVGSEVIAGGDYLNEIERAIAWAAADPDPDEEFDDPEYRGTHEPLVKDPRAPMLDGRRPATRWRRLSAGLLDELLVGVPTALASHAGAAAWTVVVMHLVYFTAPTALWGWSIGKLWLGTRVVDVRTLRSPGWVMSAVRWSIPYAPVMVALIRGLNGDAIGFLMAIVYAPILFDLRGVHDRLAHTAVVERTTAGPKAWKRVRIARWSTDVE